MINKVILEGRLTKDATIRITSNSKKFATFSIALNRGKDKNGNDLGADYPNIVCWEKTAEMVEKWFKKGDGICIEGKLQTRSYDDNGKKVYVTEILANSVTFPEAKAASVEQREPDPVYEFGSFSIERNDLPF